MTAVATGREAKRVRTQDPEGTKRNIIEVASREFSESGLAGARIDEIAAKTKTSKRMIYYYFGDKEGLYLSVLEEAYRSIRKIEAGLDLADAAPVEALRRLVGFTFDHHLAHEEFIRLVMIENIHRGKFLAKSKAIRELNVSAIGTIEQLYERGVKAKVFRTGVDAVDLHRHISALCFFNVSNRATFSAIFGREQTSKAAIAALRDQAIEIVERYLVRPEALARPRPRRRSAKS